jgi:predicted tellurium resistance membrane protein TerC
VIEVFSQPGAWIALLSLTALEIVLGIDNVVFIAILAARLPADQQKRAYRLGLLGALVSRLALLLALSWVMKLSDPLFELLGKALSGRDLILLGGGLFLMAKSTREIFDKLEVGEEHAVGGKGRTLLATVLQITVLDIVFSLDSVITAVGMSNQIPVMVAAIMIAIAVMLAFAQPIGNFVNRHPSMKVLALSFLLLIGVLLVAEGFGQHIDKGYVYFAMGFSLIVRFTSSAAGEPGGNPARRRSSANSSIHSVVLTPGEFRNDRRI